MSRKFSAPALGMIVAIVAAACAAPGRPPSDKAAAPLPQDQALVDAAQKAGEKEVIWWSVASIDANTVIAPFEAKHPSVKVNQEVVFPSQGATRLVEEAKTGVKSVDLVFWTDPAMQILLDAGLLAEYEWPGASGWPNQPDHNFWRGLGINTYAFTIINTKTLPKEQWPQTFEDLKDPKYKGRVVASSSRETVILETAWYWRQGDQLDWDRATKYWTDVVKNTQPAVTQGFEAPMERFAAGEFDLFISVPIGNTFELMWKGSPIALLPEKRLGGYNFPLGILKNAPNPNAARLLSNYLTSDGLVPLLDNRGVPANSPEAAKSARANKDLAALGVTVEVMPLRFLTPDEIKRSGDIWHGLLGLR